MQDLRSESARTDSARGAGGHRKARAAVSLPLKGRAELGHVVLWVRDLETSRRFYREVVGWHELGELRPGRVAFSSGRTHHELYLIEVVGEATPIPPTPRIGLYHVGVKVGGSDVELVSAKERLVDAGAEIIGASNDSLTHSIYVLDPDGNEIELYIDVQPEVWRERFAP